MFKRGLLLIFAIFSSLFGVGLSMDSYEIIPQKGGFKVHIEFTAYDLNTPIPESDEVTALLEFKKFDSASYPALEAFRDIRRGCLVDKSGNCIKKSKDIEVFSLGSNVIRPPSVWYKYGGIGEWKKRAPNVVHGVIDSFIPPKYQGRVARLHLVLKHIIGGPYAAWPGISFYHDIDSVTLSYLPEDTNTSTKIKSDIYGIDSNDSKSVELALWAECKGYKEKVAFLEIEDIEKISQIKFKGFLKDYKDRAIKKKCKMSIVSSIIYTDFLSDENGTYQYVANLNQKGFIDYERRDFFLEKNITKVRAKVIDKPKLTANGRTYELKVKFFANSKPLANRELFLSYKEGGIAKRGNLDAIYVDVPDYWMQTVKTNSSGVGKVFIDAPKANRVRLLNPEKFFPISTPLTIFIDDEDEIFRKVGEISLSWESPYPIITKFLIPGGMMAQHWQSSPSKLYIKDNDSNESFNVDIIGKGRFRVKGGIVSKNYIQFSDVKEVPIVFYYASPPLGLDLNTQPDLKKALWDVTLKEVLVNLGIFGLESLSRVESSSKLIEFFQKNRFKIGFKSKKKAAILQGVKDATPSVLKTGADTVGLFTTFETEYDTKKAKMYDVAVGGVLTALDFISIYTSYKGLEILVPQEALALEVAKAVYSYGKVFIAAYDRYGKIASSYEDIVLVPIFVRVTDKDGYQAVLLRSCAVRIFRGD